jgi:methionyl aminopeptidase
MTHQMIELKSARELAYMRDAGQIVAEVYSALNTAVKPGAVLRDLDRLAEQVLRKHGAEPLYKGYKGSSGVNTPFPGVTCTSINNEICHGIPDKRVLKEGDIVGIDVGLRYKGYCSDACVTYAVGQISDGAKRLMEVSLECLWQGISAAQAGGYLNDIGAKIEDYAHLQGFSVVRDLTGHGVGKRLHEAPSVLHVRQAGRGPRLRAGMVFTIEPMINVGTHERRTLADGWTEVTADGSLSSQFEHTIAITDNGPEILSHW